MEIKKENNQFYAEYIESRITSYINKEEYFLPNCLSEFVFSEQDLKEMDEDARLISQFLQGDKAIWVGRHCGNEKCDIIINGTRQVEIKYVSSGAGTYLNASLKYFSDRLGFVPFTEYTHKTICPLLEEEYGEEVYKNFSPVTISESKNIRHNKTALYKKIKEADKQMRQEYVTDLFNFFNQNPEKLTIFIADCITKNINNKDTPDELVIFNHQTKEITYYTKETILQKIKNKTIRKTNLGFVFDGFRVSIGWQNGNGLNNPTFRVFLKGE